MATAPSGTHNFKVVLLGEGCVGKTSLLLRYIEDKFNDKHLTTLQVGTWGIIHFVVHFTIIKNSNIICQSQVDFVTLNSFTSLHRLFINFVFLGSYTSVYDKYDVT